MFDSIKIYINEELDVEKLSLDLVNYGYRACKRVSEEGDFARLGDTVTIYPVTFEYPLRIELLHNSIEKIRSVDPITYESVQEHTVAIILPITGIAKRKIRRKELGLVESFDKGSGFESPIDNFVDIEPGDYVVHVDHGIGKYLGVEKIKVDKKYIDHLVIEYVGGDKLYVPFGDLDKLHKYLGFEKRLPKLNKLGSKVWKGAKEQARKGVYKVAVELLELQAKRSAVAGFKFSVDTEWQAQMEKDFPYKETPDQIKSTIEVKRDMEQAKPMDRLLCGDVG